MTAVLDPSSGGQSARDIPGHVSVAARVLQKVGSAIVAESLAVETRAVRVEARDDEGRLALRIATPISVPVLSADVVAPSGGVLGTIRTLQGTVTRRMNEITGRAVSRVDVTVTGSQLERSGVVR
ncbi:MAG: hypothetical protein JWP75_4125 [Frondihabitans sp.]|nr:hypothetical protein [Frondihabitans sp.]